MKRKLRQLFILFLILFSITILMTGIINSLYVDVDIQAKIFMTLLGVSIMLVLIVVHSILFRSLTRPFREIPAGKTDERQKNRLIKRLETIPVALVLFMAFSNLIGPPLITLILYAYGIEITAKFFTVGMSFIVLVATIFTIVLYLSANYLAVKWAIERFIPKEEHIAYARKRFLPGNIFLAIFSTAFFPLFVIFSFLLVLSYTNSGEDVVLPVSLIVTLGILFAGLFVLLAYLFINAVLRMTSYKQTLTANLLPDLAEQYGMTDREKQIVSLVMEGKSNQLIGEELYISIPTVKNHLSNVYKKLEVHNRSQLMRKLIAEQNENL